MTARRAVAASVLALGLIAAACGGSLPAASPPPDGSGDWAAALPGTSWVVTSVGGTATVPPSRPTLAFGEDGQVQGTGGCNGYGGPYRVDGGSIEVGEVASTLILCEGEVGLQEAAFMAALRGARTWRIDEGGDLVLDGASEIVAGPAVTGGPDGPVEGLMGTWELSELGSVAGFAQPAPFIQFAADGGVSGFAGCNTFSGTYTVDGSSLTLGPLAATKIGCQRPASAVEAAFLEALSGATGWAVEPDGRLRLDGPVTLRFIRS